MKCNRKSSKYTPVVYIDNAEDPADNSSTECLNISAKNVVVKEEVPDVEGENQHHLQAKNTDILDSAQSQLPLSHKITLNGNAEINNANKLDFGERVSNFIDGSTKTQRETVIEERNDFVNGNDTVPSVVIKNETSSVEEEDNAKSDVGMSQQVAGTEESGDKFEQSLKKNAGVKDDVRKTRGLDCCDAQSQEEQTGDNALVFNRNNADTHTSVINRDPKKCPGNKSCNCEVRFVGLPPEHCLCTHKKAPMRKKQHRDRGGFGSDSRKSKQKVIHETERIFKCDVCGQGLGDRRELKRHIITHTGEKPYKCDVCNVCFAWSGSLYAHKRIHTGEKPYICDVCGTGFAHSSNLGEHKMTHAKEKPYKCDVCGTSFSISRYLKKHRVIHTGEKPFKCDICGAGFAQGSSLYGHKKIHTGEKPYKCEVCGVGFARRNHLKSHSRTHTGEKPYQCDICSLRFSQKENLNRHRGTHAGEKPYKCEDCGVSFTQRSTLYTHRRLHTGEKPYKCDVCGVKFVGNSSLYKHKKLHARKKKL